jgi:uncharacterized membrane protein SirB2
MNTQTFLSIDLVLHITGFTMMAGTVFADYFINRKVNRYLVTDKSRAVGVLDSVSAFPRIIGIGAALLVITGIAMVSIFKAAVASALWFKIKMVLVVLVAVIGAGVLGRGGNRLKALLQANDDRNNAAILALKRRLGVFHGIELLLFLLIFILSVFKF